MSWCFGLVNNRLAEIFYKRNKSVVTYMGHAFVKKTEVRIYYLCQPALMQFPSEL